MSRSLIQKRIRAALDSVESVPELPVRLPAHEPGIDRTTRFEQELEAVGGVYFDGRGDENLSRALSCALAIADTDLLYWEDPSVLAHHRISHRLRDPLSFDGRHLVYSSHPNRKTTLPLVLNARLGARKDLTVLPATISSAAAGVAETGSVLMQTREGRGRLFAFLPPTHVCLLSERDLVATHAELFQRGLPKDGSLLTLVTGPSRTADIEKTLVIGVHGPCNWIVILTE